MQGYITVINSFRNPKELITVTVTELFEVSKKNSANGYITVINSPRN